MSSKIEALISLKQEKTERLFFLSSWTLARWNQADEFGQHREMDSNIKHNVIDILCLIMPFRSVAREEDNGLAFYPVTNKEYERGRADTLAVQACHR